MARTYRIVGIWSFLLLLVNLCSCDINQDKAECANQLVGLATCLPYVGGDAKSPTPDCCTSIKQVLKASKKCVCVLIKDRNDPGLGLKVNATLVLNLPKLCHFPAKDTISQCPALLHLPPNSAEAKMYSDFEKAAEAPTSSTPASTSTGKSTGGGGAIAKETSDSAKGKSWLVAQMFYGVLSCCLVSYLALNMI